MTSSKFVGSLGKRPQKGSPALLYTIEDEDTMCLRNVGSHLLKWRVPISQKSAFLHDTAVKTLRIALFALYSWREFSHHRHVILHCTKILLLTGLANVPELHCLISVLSATKCVQVPLELLLSLQPQKLVRPLSCINNCKELKVHGIVFVPLS